MVSFFTRLFNGKSPCDRTGLQRSVTINVPSDSSDSDDDGPSYEPNSSRTLFRMDKPDCSEQPQTRRIGADLRRSQTFGGNIEPKSPQVIQRVSTSSCDSCIPDDPLRLRFTKLASRHRGKMAVIFQGMDRKTRRPVIIKAYSKVNMSASMQEKIDREQAALKAAVSCQGIVKMITVVEDISNSYVVLESVPGSTLIEVMANNGGRLSEPCCVMNVVHPLLSALASLHALGIVHRDIKPEHIMCCSKHGVKLVDFVHSAQQNYQCLNSRIGSLEYMAPEVVSKPSAEEVFHQVLFKGLAENELAQYDEKVDIWSAGVVIYEALTGQQPFLAEDLHELQQLHQLFSAGGAVLPYLRSTDLSPLAKDFLAAALRFDPAQRPSAQQLLQHPWVTQYAPAPVAETINEHCMSWSGSTPTAPVRDTFRGKGSSVYPLLPVPVSCDTVISAAS